MNIGSRKKKILIIPKAIKPNKLPDIITMGFDNELGMFEKKANKLGVSQADKDEAYTQVLDYIYGDGFRMNGPIGPSFMRKPIFELFTFYSENDNKINEEFAQAYGALFQTILRWLIEQGLFDFDKIDTQDNYTFYSRIPDGIRFKRIKNEYNPNKAAAIRALEYDSIKRNFLDNH